MTVIATGRIQIEIGLAIFIAGQHPLTTNHPRKRGQRLIKAGVADTRWQDQFHG